MPLPSVSAMVTPQHLPHDVVADIAEFAVNDAASLFAVAHVCRAWRRHLVDCPPEHASGAMWGGVYHSVRPREVPMPVTMDPTEMIAIMQQRASQGPSPATPGEAAIIQQLCLPRLANVNRLRPTHPAHFVTLLEALKCCAPVIADFDGSRVGSVGLWSAADVSRVLAVLASNCPHLTRLQLPLSWVRALHREHPDAPLFDRVEHFELAADGGDPAETEAEKAAVAAALGRFTRLSRLHLHGLCLRDPASYSAITAGSAATLTALDLMDAWIQAPAIAAVARQCRGLLELGLSGVDLAEFPDELFECLPKLTSLDLSGNHCGDAFVAAMLDGIGRARHERLATVNLSGNPVTSEAVVSFAAADAQHRRCLRDLCLSYTIVDDSAADALCELGFLSALALNSTLVSDDQLQRIGAALSGTTEVQS